MAKIRLQITKGEAVRYISHLDYARAVERTIRRAKLPVAYSEGFNPHMKMAFASALALGVTSEAEYMDIELSREIPLETFTAAFAAQLPGGIELKKATYLAPQTPALMKVVNLATYVVKVPLTGGDYGKMADALKAFNLAAQAIYIKESPKGKREIDIKKFLDGEIKAEGCDDAIAELTMAIHITPTGSVKPGEVLAALVKDYALPVEQDAALIHRTGLFVNTGQGRQTPISL